MIERIREIIGAFMVILGFVFVFGILLGAGRLDWWVPAIYITEISLGILIIVLGLFK